MELVLKLKLELGLKHEIIDNMSGENLVVVVTVVDLNKLVDNVAIVD